VTRKGGASAQPQGGGKKRGQGPARKGAAPGAGLFGRLGRALRRLVVGFVLVSCAQVLLLRWVDPPLTLTMLQISGWTAYRYHPLPRAEVPPVLQEMVVAGEDDRFWTHHGVDLGAVWLRARECSLRAWKKRAFSTEGCAGASTLTMQVARNVFLFQGGGIARKAVEAWYAVLLDALVPKERILEVYLQVAQFGKVSYGAREGAREVLGIEPAALDELSAPQAATLVGMLPCPNTCTPATPRVKSTAARALANWRAGAGKPPRR
jgi:monofunctional biosynthetic peptidoglycan transglycosylase